LINEVDGCFGEPKRCQMQCCGKARELHEVEAGALKATDPLTLPAFLKGGSSKQRPDSVGANELPHEKGAAAPLRLTLSLWSEDAAGLPCPKRTA
jgi:hypothetical protein